MGCYGEERELGYLKTSRFVDWVGWTRWAYVLACWEHGRPGQVMYTSADVLPSYILAPFDVTTYQHRLVTSPAYVPPHKPQPTSAFQNPYPQC